MTISSRRAVLAGAASLSATIGTGAALAKPETAETSFPDLVARFIPLRERRNAQFAKDKVYADFIQARFYEATGEHWSHVRKNGGRAFWAKRKVYAKIQGENPTDAATVWDEINNQLWELAEEVVKRQPQSPVDLAWQAEIVFVSALLNEEDDDNSAMELLGAPFAFIKNARTLTKTSGFI